MAKSTRKKAAEQKAPSREKQILYAITLRPPWGWAILYLGKDIENRTWRPSSNVLPAGNLLGIHGGKQWDEEGAQMLRRKGYGLPPPDQHPTGLLCLREFQGITLGTLLSQWHIPGQLGWKLGDGVKFKDPIPMPGRQGLWRVPDEHLPAVRTAYRTGTFVQVTKF